MTYTRILANTLIFACLFPALVQAQHTTADETLNTRINTLVEGLDNSPLKEKLKSCLGSELTSSNFSIAHRGAPLGYPEHTREGYIAAAQMGAGYIECDVTFTKDLELVCRHSQCDLHSTTNILSTPLAKQCSSAPNYDSKRPFTNTECCTSDITLEQFKTLKGRNPNVNKKARTLDEYLSTDKEAASTDSQDNGTLLSHKESIQLFKSLGVKMIPELKKPSVKLPFNGMTQEQFASALVQEYIEADVTPDDVVLQSFNMDDIEYWRQEFPDYAKNAVWLEWRYRVRGFNPSLKYTWKPDMQSLRQNGLERLAPPLWMLLSLDADGAIIPSPYAMAAKEAGLELTPWTLERSGSLSSGGGWYYKSVSDGIKKDSDVLRVLDVLAREVKVSGVFSDWPATTTFYANCMGLP